MRGLHFPGVGQNNGSGKALNLRVTYQKFAGALLWKLKILQCSQILIIFFNFLHVRNVLNSGNEMVSYSYIYSLYSNSDDLDYSILLFPLFDMHLAKVRKLDKSKRLLVQNLDLTFFHSQNFKEEFHYFHLCYPSVFIFPHD